MILVSATVIAGLGPSLTLWVLLADGTKKVIGNTISLSETPGQTKGPPPPLGNATAELMGELGFSAAEVEGVLEHTKGSLQERSPGVYGRIHDFAAYKRKYLTD